MANPSHEPYRFGGNLSQTSATVDIANILHSRQVFYVTRFEYQRPPGVLATGLGIVCKDTINDWSQTDFFTMDWDENGRGQVSCFKIEAKTPEQQKEILTAVENVQYLVSKSGELVGVNSSDMLILESVILMSKPMFDEQAIINTIKQDGQSSNWLYTNNSFGTFADVIHGKIAERAGEVLGWKTVGRDPRLLPTSEKMVQITPWSTLAAAFHGLEEADAYSQSE